MLNRLFPNRNRKPAPLREIGKSNQPHMINTYKGFVRDLGNEIRFTADSRLASVYSSFDEADTFAKDVVMPMLAADDTKRHKQYFAILISA